MRSQALQMQGGDFSVVSVSSCIESVAGFLTKAPAGRWQTPGDKKRHDCLKSRYSSFLEVWGKAAICCNAERLLGIHLTSIPAVALKLWWAQGRSKAKQTKTSCTLKDLVMLFTQIPLLIMAVTWHALRGKKIFPVVPTCINPWDFQSRSKTALRHQSESCWLGQPEVRVLLPQFNVGTHNIPQPLSHRVLKCRKLCGFPLSRMCVIPTLATSELGCTLYPQVLQPRAEQSLKTSTTQCLYLWSLK